MQMDWSSVLTRPPWLADHCELPVEHASAQGSNSIVES
jgi:hypothetical protein